MVKIPKFRLYGEGDPAIEDSLQPHLNLRSWSDLEPAEKGIATQELRNSGWIKDFSREILSAVSYLNHHCLGICPGKNLHNIPPKTRNFHDRYGNEGERMKAALVDFQEILLREDSEVLVFRMLTAFAKRQIDNDYYKRAENESDDDKRREHIDNAFGKFDRLANCLNHIFEKFSINAVLTRNGLVPRQDERITEDIYVPTLKVLADPQWKNVSADLNAMFTEYREEHYAETITHAHRAVQRFLQILVGEEGKSGQGEVGKLFGRAKKEKLIPVDRFSEPLIQVFQSFISSARATKSTAKPTKDSATPADALLVMNLVIVFLQHCLQNAR